MSEPHSTDRVIRNCANGCWWADVGDAGEWVDDKAKATRMDAATATPICQRLKRQGYQVLLDFWHNPPQPERTRIPEW